MGRRGARAVFNVPSLVRRICTTVMMALLVIVVRPSDAQAHAALVRSDPADNAILAESPGEARLWFNESISAEFSSVQVLDLHGQPVKLAGIRRDAADHKLMILTLPELGAGVYSVHWRGLSEADGHFTQGLMVFGVGDGADVGAAAVAEAQSSIPVAEVLLRWLNFGLLAALIGGLAARYVVLRAADDLPAVAPAVAKVRKRVLAVALASAAASVAVGLGLLLYQAAALRQSLPEGASILEVIGQLLNRSRWGALWSVRQAVLLAFTSLMLLIYREEGARQPLAAQRFMVGVVALLALSLPVVQALNGHSAALTTGAALAVAVDALHLLGVSLWLGTLLALFAGLLPLLRQGRAEFVAVLRAGLRPFGRLAAPSVGLIAATGIYSMGRQVTSPDALLLTLYGRALLGKVGLMMAVGALGLLNSMLLHPRVAAPLARLLQRPDGWTPLSLRRLPLLVTAEAGLGLLLFLAAGLLTSSAPARGPEFAVATEDLRQSMAQTVDDLLVTFSAKPNKPGQNVMTIGAVSSRRPAPSEVLRVILRFTYQGEDMGTITADADQIEPNLYRLGGGYFSLPGPWQVEVAVRRKGMEDSVARFAWTVAPAGEAGKVIVSRRPWEPLLTVVAGVLLALVLALAASSLLVGRRRRAGKRVANHSISRASFRP